MTHRQRILAALNHNPPDRIPIDFSGHRSSGIAALVYPKLRRMLGLPEKPIRVYDLIQQLAIVDDDVLDIFNVDTIELGRGFALEEDDWKDWELPDGTPCQIPAWCQPQKQTGEWIILNENGHVAGRMPKGAIYFEQTWFPLADGREHRTIETMLNTTMWSMESTAAPPGPVSDKVLRKGAQKLRQHTDRAILGLFGGNLLETGQMFYRHDNFFMLLAAEPAKTHKFLDNLVALHLKNLEKFLSLVGESIDIIVFGDDLGMQTGPQISPKMYREFFKARHRILWNKVKQLANVKVMLHCCGGIKQLLPDLIDAGLDAVNPVQISCRGMDTATLKKEFGKDITFWGGGCDTSYYLPNSSPRQIKEHVKRQIEILSPGGGFVFQQVHNILANVPPESIIAMFEAVNSF
ncbi:methyltransferase [candidate division KSB1 bacterium]|nr:methyltransferase [candidate division KSB1 bacterium]